MARPPKLNWTKSLGQYTVTLDKKLHRLGTDKVEARALFKHLMARRKERMDADPNVTFGEVADRWLDHVEATQDPERFCTYKGRVNDFLAFLGPDARSATWSRRWWRGGSSPGPPSRPTARSGSARRWEAAELLRFHKGRWRRPIRIRAFAGRLDRPSSNYL